MSQLHFIVILKSSSSLHVRIIFNVLTKNELRILKCYFNLKIIYNHSVILYQHRLFEDINIYLNPQIVCPCYHNKGPRICLSVSVRQMRHPCSYSEVCRPPTGLCVSRISNYLKYVELCRQLGLLNGGPYSQD